LFVRELKIIRRDPRPSKVRLIQSIVFALLIGILYYHLGHNQSSLRNRFGAMFFFNSKFINDGSNCYRLDVSRAETVV